MKDDAQMKGENKKRKQSRQNIQKDTKTKGKEREWHQDKRENEENKLNKMKTGNDEGYNRKKEEKEIQNPWKQEKLNKVKERRK